jgi:outer membrane protein assembly factor BamB
MNKSLYSIISAICFSLIVYANTCFAGQPASDRALPEIGKTDVAPNAAWPGWRGPNRDGLVAALPDKLPAAAKVLWKKQLNGAGLAGLAATEKLLIVADRDPLDINDLFLCLRTDTGEAVWRLEYPAPGKLDYGNSPRATPLIAEDKVYLLGAMGDLHCVNLADKKVLWEQNVVRALAAKLPVWGMCSSPLIVDDKLIVNPGAKDASLVALNRRTGKLIWRSPGAEAAYASFIVGQFGGKRQIVGYDKLSLGGWDPETGKRLWTLVPPNAGDFNVPTPIAVVGKLLVATENNGTRRYDFDDKGKIVPKPAASFDELAPDSATPVVLGDRVFGCRDDLFCLGVADLKPLWTGKDDAFAGHVSIIGGRDRVLIVSARGELLLVSAGEQQFKLISRLKIFDENSEVLSHPALVGNRLYIRDNKSVCCVSLDEQ